MKCHLQKNMHGCTTRKSLKGISGKDARKQNNQPISLWIINYILGKFHAERTGGRGESLSPPLWWYAQQSAVGYGLVLYEFTLTSTTQVPPQTAGVLPFQSTHLLYSTSYFFPNPSPVLVLVLLPQMASHCKAYPWPPWQSRKSQPCSTRATETLLMWDPVERQGGGWTGFLFWNQPKTSGFTFRLHCKFLAHLPGVLLAPMTQVVTGSHGRCVLFFMGMCLEGLFPPVGTAPVSTYIRKSRCLIQACISFWAHVPKLLCEQNVPVYLMKAVSMHLTAVRWRSLLPLIFSYSLIYRPSIFHLILGMNGCWRPPVFDRESFWIFCQISAFISIFLQQSWIHLYCFILCCCSKHQRL